MQDDFFDDLDLDDDDELEETPDWMDFGTNEVSDDEPDEFDRLRQKSARAGSAFDEMTEEDPFRGNESRSSFSLQGLTPSQRTILAVLVLLNVIVIGAAVVLLIL